MSFCVYTTVIFNSRSVLIGLYFASFAKKRMHKPLMRIVLFVFVY
jgi:hypothetical protein